MLGLECGVSCPAGSCRPPGAPAQPLAQRGQGEWGVLTALPAVSSAALG